MIKHFTSDLQRNVIKILCLTVGLAIGFVLVAKIYFEETFDTFFPDVERIFVCVESAELSGEYKEFEQCPGAVAPGLRRHIPQIESATRYVNLTGDVSVTLEDGSGYEIRGIALADSCFFDVFQTEIIEGNPHDILSTQDNCIIPESLAKKMGGNIIGKKISCPSIFPDYQATIAGIYKDFQDNTTLPRAIYLGMPTIGKFMFDGREDWLGNDMFKSYVKLHKGVSPSSLQPAIDSVLKENVDPEALEVLEFKIRLRELVGSYTSRDGVKTMIWLLSLLAMIILLSSGVNYLLIVIGQYNGRSKEMAVRKCYGTSNLKLFLMVVGESSLFLLFSLSLAVLVILVSGDICNELLGVSPVELFSIREIWIVEGAVLIALLAITGVVPGWMYCKAPVSRAFRKSLKSKKIWKLAMLAVQFFSAGLLFSLLALVGRQFNMISHIDWGFDVDKIGVVNMSGVESNDAKRVAVELNRLSEVEGTAFAEHNFINGGDGNNMWRNNDREKMVNIADLGYANPEIFDVVGLKFVQGSNFPEYADSTVNLVIVEEKMIEGFAKYFGDTDSDLVGKTFKVTGHPEDMEFTICGVVNNMHRGGFESESVDNRVGLIFPSSGTSNNLYIRFNEIGADQLQKVQAVINRELIGQEVYIMPLKSQIDGLYINIKRFQKSVLIVGIAILIIAFLGLIGYSSDEVQRRSKEIAIRKVTGTTEMEILKLLCSDIARVAIPSLVLGGVMAYIVGKQWISQFTEQVEMAPMVFILSVVVLLLIILTIVALNGLKVARGNPVNYLRNE